MSVINGGVVIPGSIERGQVVLPPGQEYYVDSVNGLDTNSGTSWNTAFKTMAYAFTVLADRDTIYIRGDSMQESPGNTPAGIDYVTVVGTGNIPRSTRWRRTSGSDAVPIVIVRGTGWTFRNIKFEGPPDSSALRFLRDGTYNAQDFQVLDCEFASGGIGIENNGGCGNFLVRGCRFHDLTSGASWRPPARSSAPRRRRRCRSAARSATATSSTTRTTSRTR